MKYHRMCLPLQIAPTDQCYKVSRYSFVFTFDNKRYAKKVLLVNLLKHMYRWNGFLIADKDSLVCAPFCRSWRKLSAYRKILQLEVRDKIVIVLIFISFLFRCVMWCPCMVASWHGVHFDSTYNVQLTIIKNFTDETHTTRHSIWNCFSIFLIHLLSQSIYFFAKNLVIHFKDIDSYGCVHTHR